MLGATAIREEDPLNSDWKIGVNEDVIVSGGATYIFIGNAHVHNRRMKRTSTGLTGHIDSLSALSRTVPRASSHLGLERSSQPIAEQGASL